MKTLKQIAPILICLLLAQSASAVISIYIGSPGQIESTMADISEAEDFKDAPTNWDETPYESDLGTYTLTEGSAETGKKSIYGADDSEYLALAPDSEIDLQLNRTVQYFGFAWPAGDANNQITVYNNGVALFTLDTADIVDFLPRENSTITSIDGTDHDTIDYYGQPEFKKGKLEKLDKRENNNEPYAYIHIIATGGDEFDSITFEHRRAGGKFETDNHTIIDLGSSVTPEGDYVKLYNDAETELPPVPEPSSYAILMGLFALGVVGR